MTVEAISITKMIARYENHLVNSLNFRKSTNLRCALRLKRLISTITLFQDGDSRSYSMISVRDLNARNDYGSV